MRKKQVQLIVAIAVLGLVAAFGALTVFTIAEDAKRTVFKGSFEDIVLDTNSLTREYQAEEGKWRAKQYDNITMISVVDRYQPRYQELIDRAEALETPERYKNAQSFLVKALESEMQSNGHFRNYLATGDPGEYAKSTELLSKSLAYSADADSAIKAAG